MTMYLPAWALLLFVVLGGIVSVWCVMHIGKAFTDVHVQREKKSFFEGFFEQMLAEGVGLSAEAEDMVRQQIDPLLEAVILANVSSDSKRISAASAELIGLVLSLTDPAPRTSVLKALRTAWREHLRMLYSEGTARPRGLLAETDDCLNQFEQLVTNTP